MGVHRYAVAAALATFALLIFGGLVSTTESGLACPDWPLCEGRFFPRMVDGKQYEHTHRLVASFVGAMTFGLTALVFKHRRRDRPLEALGVLAAVGITVQALLGALTVVLKLPWWVSTAHLATAMAFFSLSVLLAFLTHPGWRAAGAARAPAWVWGTVGLSYVQLVSGALMRHTRAGLACGLEFPTCLGAWWPAGLSGPVAVHLVHRALGVAVAAAALGLARGIWLRGALPLATRRLALACGAAALAQVALGALTVWLSRDLIAMTLHSTLGAALLAGELSVALLLSRRSSPAGARDVLERADRRLTAATGKAAA